MVDLASNVPARDVRMVASTTSLLARESTHPALLTLFAQRAQQVHSTAGWFNRAREFPNMRHSELPIAKEGERAINEPVPMLQRYLPFWLANLIERMWLVLGILLAALLPLSRSCRRCTSSGCAHAFSAGTAACARSKTRWSPEPDKARKCCRRSMRWKPRLKGDRAAVVRRRVVRLAQPHSPDPQEAHAALRAWPDSKPLRLACLAAQLNQRPLETFGACRDRSAGAELALRDEGL